MSSRLGRLIQSYLDAHPEQNKKQFAERAGITPQSLSGYLTGKAAMKEYPARESIEGLAAAMGLRYCDVLDTITLDLGHSVVREEIDPEVAVTMSSMQQLSPERRRAIAQMVASIAQQG